MATAQGPARPERLRHAARGQDFDGRPQARLGEILVESGAIGTRRLDALLARQRRSGLRLGELAVAEGAASAQAVRAALARQWSIGEIDLGAAPPDPAMLSGCDPAGCLRALCVPWRRMGRTTVVAIADPAMMREAATICAPPSGVIAFALADASDIRAALAEGFRPALRARAVARVPERLSVRAWGHASGRAGAVLAVLLVSLVAALGPGPVLAAALVWAVGWNIATLLMRGAALALSFGPEAAAPGDLPRLSRFRKPPTVSVLVPLYRETAVLAPLIEALSALDYPPECLDIMLIVEEDDTPMLNALAARSLPATMRVLAVPEGRPRTKPRALNYALDFARGEIVGVYDAEDQPDPGQIRAVADRFAEAPARMACVQARLGYYNAAQNWLSRCFAIEYATWFEVLLPGIQRLGLPVPLGGTSVFFRRAALEAVGAWDAHNVTEDADLGMRLARSGFRTEVIASTTLEEANCHPRAWIRQRSRWLKGYVATWITHMRHPAGLLRDLGPAGFIGFQVILMGGITAYLSLPLLWLSWAVIATVGLPGWLSGLPGPVLSAFWMSLLLGQAVMLLTTWRALVRSGQARLSPWILTLPFYWPLGALAAFKAVVELAVAPFLWHKTAHGISGRFRPPPAAAPPRLEGAD